MVKAYQQEDVTYPATEESLEKLKIKIDLKNFTEGTIKKPIAIPDTYQRVENKPKGIGDIAVSMVHGTIEAADIMVFIFVLGGMIGVINKTGSFNSGLMALARKTKGREFAIVFSVSVLMVLGGTTCGIEEESVAFYPILVPVFLVLSGLAILAMPIMAPLADAVGIPRFIVVSAYNWGQYAMLFLAPTGLVLVTLQMLNIPFNKWVKFVMPMIGVLLAIGATLLVIQVSMYGR